MRRFRRWQQAMARSIVISKLRPGSISRNYVDYGIPCSNERKVRILKQCEEQATYRGGGIERHAALQSSDVVHRPTACK